MAFNKTSCLDPSLVIREGGFESAEEWANFYGQRKAVEEVARLEELAALRLRRAND